MTISFLRHEGWVGPSDLKDNLNIIGCGAVGSHVAVLACRMGFSKFTLWDDDVVADYNLANQAFLSSQIHMPKVEALREVLLAINPQVNVTIYNRRFTSGTDVLVGCVYMAVDSMAARSDIYDAILMNTDVTVCVEQRLGFNHGEVNVLDPLSLKTLEKWKKNLCDDAKVPEGPCNLRICTTLVQLTAAIGVQNLCLYYASIRHGKKWEYKPQTIVHLDTEISIIKL
jgi:hypothetical protein